MAKACWLQSHVGWTETILNMEQWFNKLNHTLNKKDIEEAIMICCEIWNYRNGVIWNQRTSTVDRILDKAISFINEYRQLRMPYGSHGQDNEENRKWKTPDGLALKCNIDASFNLATSEGGAGMVVRDRHGEFLRGRSTYIGATFSPMMAEALAVKEALSWLKIQYKDTKIELEMDSVFVKNALEKAEDIYSYLSDVISDCKNLLKGFQFLSLSVVRRSANPIGLVNSNMFQR